MRAKLLAWFALVVGLGLVIAACNGDDGAPATTPTPQISPTEGAATPTSEEGAAGVVGLTWWGESMFVLTGPEGTRVLLDPYGDIGYRVPDPSELNVDVVTVSHEHPDHNNVELGGAARVLRGLTDDGWAEIDERVASDLRIRTVPSWHDSSKGSERGRNAIFIFETGGLRIVHLGDLGHWLSYEQIDAIGPVDVLLVPVGGVDTIGADLADEVIEQLAPRVVIPMHYKTEAVNIAELEPVDVFLETGVKQVERKGSTVELHADYLPARGSAVVWVLKPAGAQE